MSSETPAPGIVVPAAIEQTSTPPLPPVRDYSKQIEALFTVPQASAHPEPLPAAPPATQSSTEDLKQQAARLQAQLSSLLFTETPAAPPAVTPKVEPPVAEVAKKILQISQDEPKAAPPSEPPSVAPARALASTSLGVNEEVKIPSWLAPLSQNAEVGGGKHYSNRRRTRPRGDCLFRKYIRGPGVPAQRRFWWTTAWGIRRSRFFERLEKRIVPGTCRGCGVASGWRMVLLPKPRSANGVSRSATCRRLNSSRSDRSLFTGCFHAGNEQRSFFSHCGNPAAKEFRFALLRRRYPRSRRQLRIRIPQPRVLNQYR